MSQQALAERLEVSANTVTSWRRGRHLPAARHLAAIAETLGCESTTLLGSGSSGKAAKRARPDPDPRELLLRRLIELDVGAPLASIAAATPDLIEILREARRLVEAQ